MFICNIFLLWKVMVSKNSRTYSPGILIHLTKLSQICTIIRRYQIANFSAMTAFHLWRTRWRIKSVSKKCAKAQQSFRVSISGLWKFHGFFCFNTRKMRPFSRYDATPRWVLYKQSRFLTNKKQNFLLNKTLCQEDFVKKNSCIAFYMYKARLFCVSNEYLPWY